VSTPSAPRPAAPPSKPGSLSDLLGTPPPDDSARPAPTPAPPPPVSPTTTGTGPVTGTGPWTGTGPSTGRRTGTGAGSGGSWSNLSGDASSAPLAPGDTIKDRFVLEDIIGKGGMGIVFKARDLRWEEAQDRNPYVAVKVLNEDFKRHPESLKALQRESRKAQNLAHPNVVTVYQFDRDGANVFMVMELLEGEPLDKLIKRNDAGGLPPKTALKYTAHMARALAYAHEQGIIHSDFKPANAYMTRDGTVKVFDFGISRAAKRSDKVSGSMTLFDPGTLGALTPAYASCEMIDGAEPDPRDDIYALACVFYELLTGRHPFDKKSAVQARDAKLVPAPVPGLSRAQWRGLQRGLAFNREQRTPSVMQFLNEISPQKRSPAKWIAVAASVVVVGTAVALFLPGFLEKRRLQEIAEILRRGDAVTVPDGLDRLAALTPEQRGTVLNDPTARDGLLTYFERQIDAATDESKKKYDFARAFALLAQAEQIFTDSSRVANKKKALEERQADLVNRLSRSFDEALKAGVLIDKQNEQNASRLLELMAQVNPKLSLDTYKRSLAIAYTDQAEGALARSNVALADELIAAGLKLSPADSTLADLSGRVKRAAAGQQAAQRVRALQASIDTAIGTAPTLEAFDRKRTELIELRGVAPDDAALARWQGQMQSLLDRQLVRLTDGRSFAEADALLERYAELASNAYVAQRRDGLSDARKEFTGEIARLNDALLAAIRAGRLGPPAASNARSIYQSLERSGANPEQLASAKDQISTAYLRLARELRSKDSFNDARKQVTAGLDVGPSPALLTLLRDENKEIDDAEKLARATADQQVRQQLAAQRAKEDNDLKAQLAAALKTPKQTIESARSALQLAEKLQTRGVKDPVVLNARRDIQNQLLVEIRNIVEKSGPDAAIRFAEQASALMTESPALSTVLADLRKASADRQTQTRQAAITTIKTNIDALNRAPKLDDKWQRDVNAELRKLAAYLPDTDPYVVGVKRNMSNAYIAAARKSRDAMLLSEAERMIERAAELSPTHPDLANERRLLTDARVSQDKATQQAKVAAGTAALKQRLLTEAKADDTNFIVTLNALKQTLPATDSFLVEQAPFAIAESYMRLATKSARRGSFDEAVKLIDKGSETAPNLKSLRDMRNVYSNLSAANDQIKSGSSVSGREVRASLDALSRSKAAGDDPGLYADVARRFQSALDTRIRTESSRNPSLAANIEAASLQIFPDQQRTAAVRPTPQSAATSPAATPAAQTPAQTTPATTTPAQATPQAAVTPGSNTPAPATAPAAAGVSAKPCDARLQGAGKRSQAVCFDSVAAGRGPDLVVLPAGGPFSGPVAVTRFEVTNEDYNFYCTTTGRCKTVSGGPRLPIVTIGVAEGERYAAWLSEASGKTYRLPSDAEWSYIASGATNRDEVNCTMEMNGQKIKGFALAERNNGNSSTWGIYNSVGNAQEWARAPGGWVARGGAFSDNLSTCSAALGRIHNGTPDGKTGFRLVRQL
jgi:serine/threonine protein kinase